MGGTGESQNPGVGVRWVHQRRKEELVAIAIEFGLGSEGLVEDLRKRLCAFIQTNNHTPETWARLAALEAQRPKMLEPPVEGDEPCCGGRVRRVSESDLGNARIREASQHRASGMDAPGTMAVPAIKLDRGVENGETGVEVFGASGNPRDQPDIGSSTEAKPPRVVAEQVRKWGMRYDGQADPLEFVELLEERAITYGIALDRMPRAASEIFVDRAARWFLTSGLRDVTWAVFKSGFLEFFLPPQYFERLEDQIRSRRQREGEGFKDYLIEIRALMHHAGYSTTRVLHRVYENAAPEYKLYVRRQDFSTLNQLTQMASEYESVKGQKAASAGRWPSTNPAPGGRPRNPFRTSPEVASAPVSGVPALPAPGRAFREGVPKCVGGILQTMRATGAEYPELLRLFQLGKRPVASPRSGSRRRQCSRDPTVRCPLVVEGGRIVATVEIGGKAMLATIDTGATRSFMSEDCVRRWAIQGEAQNVQARIRLADGSALEVVRSLKVDVGMTGKVVNMPLLIMPSLLDHVLLGMDFLCAMGTTVRCGNAELILETVEDPTAGPVGPAVGVEDLSRGIPPLEEGRPRRRGGRRRARKAPWSSHRPASSRARTDETSKTQTVQPNSSIMAKMAEGEAVAAVDLQANGRGATVRDMGPRVESSPRFARSGSPSMSAVGDTREDREDESPEAEAEWPEDLEPELKEFLEAELALFEGLQGVSHIAEHRIRLRDDKPLKQRYYPKNPAMQRVIDEQVNELIQAGAIEPSRSPHSAPIVLVRKKTGDWRMCIDYRQLNAHSIPDAYPVPRINHILERLRHARFISTLDLKHGYWQIPMAADSRECTAFTVPGRGLYQWRVMPFGLHSACATFQRALDTVIGPEMEPHAFAYLDDIVVIGATKEQHVANLKEVFRRLRAANLKLNRKKCSFFRKRLVYLGHVISAEGICTDPGKVEAIRNLKAPASCKELRQCLGMASWYRRFVPNFATLVQPMTELLKKGRKWSWGEEQEEALCQLKEKLTTAPVLACPDFSAKFVLQTDASDYGLGAVLTQTVDDQERVIAYASRKLLKAEMNYSATEKECLAIVCNLQKASKDQGRHYNLRRREWRPSLGSMVLLRQHQLSNAAEGFAAKLAPKFDGPYRVVKFVSPNIVRLAREGERRRRVANVMQLKPFFQDGNGEAEEAPLEDPGEATPGGNDIIVISDEEEPQPEAHVEDCDSDETQPRQSPRRGQRQRDPRRGRPNYGGRRQEERPRRYRHTVYHGTHRSVDRYDGLVVCMAVEYSTMFIEVPQARNSPSYVEEPPSPP
ncbi:hypothetical protein ACLKA6_013940 [Drosophila palustris]